MEGGLPFQASRVKTAFLTTTIEHISLNRATIINPSTHQVAFYKVKGTNANRCLQDLE